MPHQQEVDMLVAEARYEIKKRDVEIERLRAALGKLEAGFPDGTMGVVMCQLTHHQIREIIRDALAPHEQ